MTLRCALVLVAIASIGCNSGGGEKPAPVEKTSATTPVSALPDLGDFASHVSAVPMPQPAASEGRQVYRVDMSYRDALRHLTPNLNASGWTTGKQILKLQRYYITYDHSTKGRYGLDSTEADGPNTVHFRI